jgi:hypothetical protein
VDYDHATIVNFFEEEVNALVKVPFERQLIKKKKSFRKCNILNFLVEDTFLNDDEHHKNFL